MIATKKDEGKMHGVAGISRQNAKETGAFKAEPEPLAKPRFSPEKQEELNRRLLDAALDFNDRGFVSALRAIAEGADVNARYDDAYDGYHNTNTVLMEAARSNCPRLVLKLLKAGADPDVRNSESKTALDQVKEHPDYGKVSKWLGEYEEGGELKPLKLIAFEEVVDLLEGYRPLK